MGYGLRYEYGIFRQTIQDGWQHEQPDNWLRRPDPGRSLARTRRWKSSSNCSFELRGGSLRADPRPGRPRLLGIPFDRPVVGYGGKTINTLRLWAAAAPDYFDFQAIQRAAISSARWPRRSRPNRSRGCSIPTTPRAWARGCASCRSISWWPARWPTSCGASGRSNADWNTLPEKVAIQLNDTHPTHGRPRADAHSARRGAVSAGTRRGTSPSGRWPTRTTRCCPRRWRNGRSPGSRCCCRATWRSSTRSTAACSTTSGRRFPGDEGRVAAHEPDRGGRRAARSAWPTWRSSARTAPTAWPRSTPSCCAR